MSSVEMIVGRCLMAALFFAGALQKAVDPGASMQLLADRGMPESLVWIALWFNLVAGVCVVMAWKLRAVSLMLAAYCAFTSLFHFVPSDGWQMSIFVKNWAIAGGFLVLASSART